MKKIIITFALASLSTNSYGFDILALGTSNTNCKNAGQAYTSTLNDLLQQEKINATVINSGLDGDKPTFMQARLEQSIKANPNIKIVIFEPGPNEKNKRFNIGASGDILIYLREQKMITIYVSHQAIQSNEEASEMAKKYGAYYYGHWIKNVPIDKEHRQYDQPGQAGHMTVVGCQLWAKNMFSFIKEVLRARKIQ
jgi:hypothetical protein